MIFHDGDDQDEHILIAESIMIRILHTQECVFLEKIISCGRNVWSKQWFHFYTSCKSGADYYDYDEGNNY